MMKSMIMDTALNGEISAAYELWKTEVLLSIEVWNRDAYYLLNSGQKEKRLQQLIEVFPFKSSVPLFI